jgi:hypothetical protein
VEDLAGEFVALLVAVELDEYFPAVRGVVHAGEQREALGDAASSPSSTNRESRRVPGTTMPWKPVERSLM